MYPGGITRSDSRSAGCLLDADAAGPRGARRAAEPGRRRRFGDSAARRRFQAGGARAEAASGFPGVYRIGLPALRRGARAVPHDGEAARVEAGFALISSVEDTNLLHRGGLDGLRFARRATRLFLDQGGVRRSGWRERARPSRFYGQEGAWGLVDLSLTVHLIFAVSTALLWIWVIAGAWRRFDNPPRPNAYSHTHRRLGWAAAIDMGLTALTGWIFYLLAFVG